MSQEPSVNTLLLVIIAILLPPLAVYLKTSSLGQTLLNVVLCIAFIFGQFGAPRMGGAGAGFAAFVSTWVGRAIRNGMDGAG